MSDQLHRLHATVLAMREPGQKPEVAAAAVTSLRAYAVAVANGLPFPFSLVRATPSYFATNRGAIHIVCAEDISLGKLRRQRGDALCKARWRFSGNLSELCATEEGATCYGCLEVAEAHSIVEWQASFCL